MITAMHEVARDEELVINKKKQQREEAKKVEPDTFPINDLTADLIEEYDSIWKVDRRLRRRMEAKFGHYLRVKDSAIEHHGKYQLVRLIIDNFFIEAGKGVFVSCRR